MRRGLEDVDWGVDWGVDRKDADWGVERRGLMRCVARASERYVD